MTAQEERALVRAIEGHLFLAAAREEGRTATARAASRLGWLTEAQRDVLEREFEAEYVAVSRLSWQRTAQRGEELRQCMRAATGLCGSACWRGCSWGVRC
ncbi:hypothetical protein ACWDBD_33210 [Streptomyces sp. NPDC001118]